MKKFEMLQVLKNIGFVKHDKVMCNKTKCACICKEPSSLPGA